MSFRVVVVVEAERQIRQVDDWWVENRGGSAELFLDELALIFELLAETPEIGRRFTKANQPGVRRILMRRTRHWVYYIPDLSRGIVYVLAVWSTYRGSDPTLPVATLAD